MPVNRSRAVFVFSVFLAACVHAPAPERDGVDVLVIAPHPDDEVLLASGVMARAVRKAGGLR